MAAKQGTLLGRACVVLSGWNRRFHLDAAKEWVADGDVAECLLLAMIDLVSVAVHDIGKREDAVVGMEHEV